MLSGRHDGNPFNPYKSFQSWFIPSERPSFHTGICTKLLLAGTRNSGQGRLGKDNDGRRQEGHFEQDSQDLQGLKGFPS